MSNQSCFPQQHWSAEAAGIASLQATIQGRRAANQATVFGIIGLFVAPPFVFGPISLVKARAANQLGVSAITGRVLGWIDIAFCAIGIAVVAFLLVGFASFSSSS